MAPQDGGNDHRRGVTAVRNRCVKQTEVVAQMPGITMEQSQFEFHIEEYRALHSERSAILTRGWNLLQYAFIFSFAFFGWILVTGNGIDAAPDRFTAGQWNLIVWIPFLTSSVSLIFSYGLYLRLVQLSNYILDLENTLAAQNLGWERRMMRENLQFGSGFAGKPTAPTTVFITISWGCLLVITFVAGVIFSR